MNLSKKLPWRLIPLDSCRLSSTLFSSLSAVRVFKRRRTEKKKQNGAKKKKKEEKGEKGGHCRSCFDRNQRGRRFYDELLGAAVFLFSFSFFLLFFVFLFSRIVRVAFLAFAFSALRDGERRPLSCDAQRIAAAAVRLPTVGLCASCRSTRCKNKKEKKKKIHPAAAAADPVPFTFYRNRRLSVRLALVPRRPVDLDRRDNLFQNKVRYLT